MKLYWFVGLIVWLILIQNCQANTYEVGNLPTEFFVEQGAARLKIPIPTPPGLSNLLPSLSLAYSSDDDGDSIVGRFWRFDGLPVISRCTKTVAQDGKQRGIEFDNEDEFCLDGARLLQVKSNEFRTEIDSYSKIEAHGREGFGPQNFTVRTKDNKILTFGGSEGSRHKPEGGNSVYAWYLSKIEDYTSKKIDFYYRINGHLPLISGISMKTRHINFTYAYRGDQRTTYRKGRVLSQMKQRLTNVTTYMNGKLDKDLRVYYKPRRVSQMSLVKRVQLCSRWKCLPPYKIQYHGENDIKSVSTSSYWTNQLGNQIGWSVQHHLRFVVDVNGDGLADVVNFGRDGVLVSLNTGKGTFSFPKMWSNDFCYASGWRVNVNPRFVIDMDGDGLADVVGIGNEGVYVSLNTGFETFATKTRWSSEFGTSNKWLYTRHLRLLEDMNGDGRPDVVGFSYGYVIVALNEGHKFSTPTAWINSFGYDERWRIEYHVRQLADVNGDGLPDVVGFINEGVYVAVNTGLTLTSYRKWYTGFGWNAGYRVRKHPRYVVDVNGDNMADIVAFHPDGVQVAFDRQISETHVDGTKTTWQYEWYDSVYNSKYKIMKSQDGKSSVESIYDSYDRVLRISSKDFHRRAIYEDFVYDRYGRIVKQSTPHIRLLESPKWIAFTYDSFGRELSITKPVQEDVTYTVNATYKPLRAIKFDKKGVLKDSTENAIGKIIEVRDGEGNSMKYTYDALGHLIETKDSQDNVVQMKYDTFGNKVWIRDANMGTWQWFYNIFGEMILQVDGNYQEMYIKYDTLGRLTERREKEGITKWSYDSGLRGIGKLVTVASEGFVRTYGYDQYGREASVTTTVDYGTFTISTFYDKNSRIEKQIYPHGKVVYFCHNEYSFLIAVRRAPCNVTSVSYDYWRALDYNEDGEVIREQTGNGLMTEYKYDVGSHLTSVKTTTIGIWRRPIRHWQYKYDDRGNLIRRNDLMRRRRTSEVFVYDNLDRLVRSTSTMRINGRLKVDTEKWKYDSIGNIVYYNCVTGVPYHYDKSKPHAVVRIGPYKYEYDENGNMIKKNNQIFRWTSFNKLESLDSRDGKVTFKYDPDRMKIRKATSKFNVTYIGKVYEQEMVTLKLGYELRNISHDQYFIYALGKLVAIEHEKIDYVYTDHLGSLDTITDSSGKVKETMVYSAFGRRRSQNRNDVQICSSVLQNSSSAITKGFGTDHKHLAEIDLIDMNGRVYDAVIGRFLSPDPHVQDPFNQQSFNRYSYVMNNPLKLKESSGLFFQLIMKIFKIVKMIGDVKVSLENFDMTSGSLENAGVDQVSATSSSAHTYPVVSGGSLQRLGAGALTGKTGGYYESDWTLSAMKSAAVPARKLKDKFIKSGRPIKACYLYNADVAYDVICKREGDAAPKSGLFHHIERRKNIATQGLETINPQGWFNEGQIISRLINPELTERK